MSEKLRGGEIHFFNLDEETDIRGITLFRPFDFIVHPTDARWSYDTFLGTWEFHPASGHPGQQSESRESDKPKNLLDEPLP